MQRYLMFGITVMVLLLGAGAAQAGGGFDDVTVKITVDGAWHGKGGIHAASVRVSAPPPGGGLVVRADCTPASGFVGTDSQGKWSSSKTFICKFNEDVVSTKTVFIDSRNCWQRGYTYCESNPKSKRTGSGHVTFHYEYVED